jgi:23S rRNA U2552 (ribose-2'-O)-methylase RlmE/FtsJ
MKVTMSSKTLKHSSTITSCDVKHIFVIENVQKIMYNLREKDLPSASVATRNRESKMIAT